MDTVALAATVGGSIVALAGVGATAWGVKQQRESARELESARARHERRLASGGRLFEKRAAVYERMMGQAFRWRDWALGVMLNLQREHPDEELLRKVPYISNEIEPRPDQLSHAEARAIRAEVAAFGSKDVANAFEDLQQAWTEFWSWVIDVPMRGKQVHAEIDEEIGDDDDEDEIWDELRSAHETLNEKVAEIGRLVSEELATL